MVDYQEIFKFIINIFTMVIPLVIVFIICDKIITMFKNFIGGN